MSDQVQGFGSQLEAGQPSETLQSEQGAPEIQQYVTMDLLRQALTEQTQQLERRLQSLSDKQENRLKREVDKKLLALEENYRNLGLQVPDAARQRVIDETVLSYLDDEGPGSQTKPPSPELVAQVNQRAQQIAAQAGVTLTPGDPEFAQINQTTANPFEYLESWERAVTSKKNRLSGVQAQQPAQPQQPTQPTVNPAARVPMAGSGAPSGQDLMAKYRQEIEQVRGDSEAVLAVRRKYRGLGLEI